MARSLRRFSLFSQPLDRAVYLAYFLGAVVPLMALAWVGQRFVSPDDVDARLAPLAAFVGLGILSLASFLALRRTTNQALARLDRDNRRLASLLAAAQGLQSTEHDQQAIQGALEAAVRLVGGGWAVYLEAGGREAEPQPRGQAGAGVEAILARSLPELQRLARAASEEARAVHEALPGSALWHGRAVWATAVRCGDETHPRTLLALHAGDGADEQAIVGPLDTLASMLGATLRGLELEEVQRNFYTHATHLLVAALDAHLDYMGEHSADVARYSLRLGRALDLDEDQIKRLHAAALLHDLGMLHIDRATTDLAVLRQHPGLGAEMLRPVRLWEDLAPIVRHHHEWWNGGGYPDGLAGDAIPLESRLIGLVEAYDSMTSATSYQRSCPPDEACERIAAASGTQFDPRLAALFVAMVRRGEMRL